MNQVVISGHRSVLRARGALKRPSTAAYVKEKKKAAPERSTSEAQRTDGDECLCPTNVAVHGLEGEIRHGGKVKRDYDAPHVAAGKSALPFAA